MNDQTKMDQKRELARALEGQGGGLHFLSLLVVLTSLGCNKDASKATVDSACNNMVALGFTESLEDCTKASGELHTLFGGSQKGLACLTKAKSKEDMAACTQYADQDALRKGMENYVAKSKSSEALIYVSSLRDRVRTHYEEGAIEELSVDSLDPQGGLAGSAHALPPTVGPTPAKGACCVAGDTCVPEPSQWEESTWKTLDFAMYDPHYYSYEYRAGDDGQSFTVSAYGDLDCDGTFSTFRIAGVVGPQGEIEFDNEVTKINELE